MKIKEPLVPELYRHFRHILSDLLRIMIRTGANGAEAVRRQDPAVQFVSPGLPVSFMLPVRNLLQEYLRQHRSPLRYSAKNPTLLLTGAFYQPPLSKKQRFDCSAALKLINQVLQQLRVVIPPPEKNDLLFSKCLHTQIST